MLLQYIPWIAQIPNETTQLNLSNIQNLTLTKTPQNKSLRVDILHFNSDVTFHNEVLSLYDGSPLTPEHPGPHPRLVMRRQGP